MMEEVFPAYHVFLNHRGPDVKKTLASLIHSALTRLGLRVFLDEHELQVGDSLSPAIEKAISSSSVHIAIFSPKYAESPWCLNELLCMLDCNDTKIIPIFCDIQPLDLRHISKGAYAQAFEKHKGRVDNQLMEKWENALNKVSKISGVVFNKDKDDHGKFLDRIIDDVLKNVRTERLDVAIHPVGLAQATEHFQNEILNQTELSESAKTIVVGIVGLGGSGKSTLVKHLYNSKRSEFRRSCFLSDVKQTPIESLQQRLLTNLLGYKDLQIWSTSEGRSLLRDRLRGFPRVLIVFDDIDDAKQIENLLLVKDVLGNGSLILVTSRDRALLSRFHINKLYDVQLLDAKDAEELFCRHAFDQPKPLQDFQDLVAKLVNICGGFPLALKVLGAQLSGNRDKRYWMRQLKKFETQMPDAILQAVLIDSYDSLENKEREAFLDIAHFLVGEDKDLAVRVLEGLVDCNALDCLDTLHQKCLVEFETVHVDFDVDITDDRRYDSFYIELWRRTKGSFKIRMHDLVRDLARQIGSRQYPLRLCCLNNIMIATQPCAVRGILIDEDKEKRQLWFSRVRAMCGLKLLVLQHSISDLQFNRLSGDLVWLRMRKFNSNDILSGPLRLRDLRVLEVTDVNFEELNRLCDGNEFPSQLHEIKVTYRKDYAHRSMINYWDASSIGFDKNSLQPAQMDASSSQPPQIDASSLQPAQIDASSSHSAILPWLSGSAKLNLINFSTWMGKLNLKNLLKMVLKNVTDLRSLPINFEESKNLRHVDLYGCSDLEVLPPSFSQLLQLQYLALRDCRKLLLPDLGNISMLEYLDLGGCLSLKQLPRGTIGQRFIKYLNLLPTRIEQLPEHLEDLKNLEQLYIGGPKLTSFPSSLNNLSQLTDLIVYHCSNLCDISKSVEQLMHLERLKIHRSGVSSLPEDIVWMNIKVLDVQHCPVNEFKIRGDPGKMPVDSFQFQGSVDHGELAMKTAPHNRVSCLTNLMIKDSSISKVCLPRAKTFLPNLEIVDLSNNQSLTEIEGLPENLVRLNLVNCGALKTLTCLSDLTSLKYLNISGCDGLIVLNVEGLRSIEVFKAEHCWELQIIEGLGKCEKLSHIQISAGNCVARSIWRDIQAFPSNLSTVSIGGVSPVSVGGVSDKMDGIVHTLQVRVMLAGLYTFGEHTFDVELEDAILLCIIANELCETTVTLLGHVYNIFSKSCEHFYGDVAYTTHIFMWTKDSEVFKDLKYHDDKPVCCTAKIKLTRHDSLEREAPPPAIWMVTAKELEFCRKFLSFLFLDGPPAKFLRGGLHCLRF